VDAGPNPPSPAPPAAWLESAGSARTLVHGTCSFGRTIINDVVLTDDKVSRRHAMVHAQSPGEYWLVDLGSANGTYLNGRRVAQPCRLADGDVIAIARHEFVFHAPTPPAGSGGEAPAETIRDVRTEDCWLLLADLENSTQVLQRLSAKDIPRVTGRWLASCKQLIDENKGAINKYLGDGFFAYWRDRDGVPTLVARAMKALQELQGHDGPRFRLVLHHGEVSIGGGASLGEESLMGPQVNFAFRVEKLAAQLSAPCLISHAAHVAFDSVLPTVEVGRHVVPGFKGEYLFFKIQ
jgi:class 3 adenylate cyclase